MQVAEYYDKIKMAEPAEHHVKLYALVAALIRAFPGSVLDIGCGEGRLVRFLKETSYCTYKGIDFSANRIATAKDEHLGWNFEVADALEYDMDGFDIYVMLEFLEHVDEDVRVISSIPPGRRVILSVPNTFDTEHVRCFPGTEAVVARYRPYINPTVVIDIITGRNEKRFFVIEGIKR